MRLINVDEFRKSIEEEGYSDCEQRDTAEWILDSMDCFEKVEAIPIEWIKGYITPFQVHHDSLSEELKENDGAGWVVDVLETMLREWEKENE